MAVLWLIVALLATLAGIVRMIHYHRKGDKDKKYGWLPVVVGGVICAIMLLEPFVGPTALTIAFWLIMTVIALVILGALGGLFTQLRELFRRPPNKRK